MLKEAPDFIPPTLWPPNCLDLNPIDYKIWSLMQQKVYKRHVKDISELRERIVAAWDELDHQYRSGTVAYSFSCLCQSSWWTFRAQTVTCCITLVVRTLYQKIVISTRTVIELHMSGAGFLDHGVRIALRVRFTRTISIHFCYQPQMLRCNALGRVCMYVCVCLSVCLVWYGGTSSEHLGQGQRVTVKVTWT